MAIKTKNIYAKAQIKTQITSLYGKESEIARKLHEIIDQYFDHVVTWSSLGLPYILKPLVNGLNVEFKVLKVNSSKVLIMRLNGKMIARVNLK